MVIDEIWGMDSHTRQHSSIGSGTFIKKTHHRFVTSAHVGSEKARLPSLSLFYVNGKMFFHAFWSLSLNHPRTLVGFAWISSRTTSRILTTTPSKFIAHLWPGHGCELKFNKSFWVWFYLISLLRLSITLSLTCEFWWKLIFGLSFKGRELENTGDVLRNVFWYPSSWNGFFALDQSFKIGITKANICFSPLPGIVYFRIIWALVYRNLGHIGKGTSYALDSICKMGFINTFWGCEFSFSLPGRPIVDLKLPRGATKPSLIHILPQFLS